MKDSFSSKNTGLVGKKIAEYWQTLNQWLLDTPERALLDAYKAAQKIKNIETEYFSNQKISSESAQYSATVMSYWQGELYKNLTIIRLRLAEFGISRSIFNKSHPDLLIKLNFIDEIIEKYTIKETIVNPPPVEITEPLKIENEEVKQQSNSSSSKNTKSQSISQKTGVLPRSIGRTINRIAADFTPQAEEQFVKNYRISKNRTRIAVRFLLMLIIVPLLTQQISKQFLINPIIERVRGEDTTQIFLNAEMEEKAFSELKSFEEKLKFQNLLQQHPPLSAQAMEESIKEKAIEIAEVFRSKSSDAISNIFADLISLGAFGVVIATSKREIVVVKSFMDEIVYGLSDSAKAFLIILSTDIFVGFHSPHGWEVILEGLSDHLGLPASRNAIFIFIATFPVILDTISKYWIFRYLSRLSPSALATLKEMNE